MTAGKVAVGSVVAIAVDLVIYALQAWVLVHLWGWLIEPSFHLAPLSFLAALGLIVVVAFLTGQPAKATPEKELLEACIDQAVQTVVRCLGYLLLGWLVFLLWGSR